MRWIIFGLILLISSILEAGNLLNSLALGSLHIRPMITVTVMVFACFNTRRQDAIRCAFAAGFAADIVSGTIGPHMICYGVIGTFLNGMSRAISTKQTINQFIIVLVFYMLSEFPVIWLDILKTGEPRQNIFRTIVLTALYSAAIAPVIWQLLSKIWGQMGRQPELRARIR